MLESYDVVVVGAGLAGLYAAERLANAGARVLLADARARVPGRTHTTGILVKKTLDDYRFPDDCLGPSVRDVRLIAPSGRALHVRSPEEAFRVGEMPRIYAHLLAGGRRRGVHWAPRHRFVASTAESGGSRVRFATPHGGREVRARLLIGADGALSHVARDLGLERNRKLLLGVEEVFGPLPRNGDNPPTFHCYLDPEIAPGYIAWVVDDGHSLHVGTAGHQGQIDPLRALGTLLDRAGASFRIQERQRIERRGGFIPVGGIHRRIGNQRGLLIGDAAGAVSPLTAGGIDACFRLSDVAVDVAQRALGARTEEEAQTTLNAYRGERFRQRFASRLMMRRLFDALGSRGSLEFGFGMAASPALRWMVRHVFFSRGSFPDIQVLPAPTAPQGMAP